MEFCGTHVQNEILEMIDRLESSRPGNWDSLLKEFQVFKIWGMYKFLRDRFRNVSYSENSVLNSFFHIIIYLVMAGNWNLLNARNFITTNMLSWYHFIQNNQFLMLSFFSFDYLVCVSVWVCACYCRDA